MGSRYLDSMLPGAPPVFYLLVASGLCFALRSKIDPLYGRFGVLDRTLDCAFCTGLHCGWITWGMFWVESGFTEVVSLGSLASWCLACGWFCYLSETVFDRLENIHD
jgi:hypothetical protein